MNAPSRRLLDHVSPRERIDRRTPHADLKRRSGDRVPAYAVAFALLMGLSAIYDNVRMRDKLADIEEQHALELVAKIAVIASLLPPPPSCQEYSLHMEHQTLTHCMKISRI